LGLAGSLFARFFFGTTAVSDGNGVGAAFVVDAVAAEDGLESSSASDPDESTSLGADDSDDDDTEGNEAAPVSIAIAVLDPWVAWQFLNSLPVGEELRRM